MNHYDHRVHAGNAGDVWKHFLLLEAANCLLDPDSSLIYAESHVGRPSYALRAPGDWEGGIRRIWHSLPFLLNFSYFRILSELNPGVLERDPVFLMYPGSARFIIELAKRKNAYLRADVWDIDSAVEESWKEFSSQELNFFQDKSPQFPPLMFHHGDGFSGVLSWLDDSPLGGLLFIDPPYVRPDDIHLSRKLLQKAKDRGWIVLWWYMMGMNTAPSGLETFELQFSDAGLDGGRWKGAVIACAGPDGEQFNILLDRLHRQNESFISILGRRDFTFVPRLP
jgi:23S rRNA (adenine2030-N6)-methyltransferase